MPAMRYPFVNEENAWYTWITSQ